MKIRWLGHSCFRIEYDGFTIVLDPFKPNMIPGLGILDLAADRVYCSHEHGDHNHRAGVRLSGTDRPDPFGVVRLPSFHDAEKGAKRGTNILTLLSAGGVRLAHLGDLGCPLEPEQIAALAHVDALLIPVGGYYTIDADAAKRLCDAIAPRVVVPMHYRGPGFGPAVLDPVERFTSLFPPGYVRRFDTDTLTIDPATPPMVAVLRYGA